MQFILSNLPSGLASLQSDENDFADMSEISRDPAVQAEAYVDVPAGIQRKKESASNAQVSGASRGETSIFAQISKLKSKPGLKQAGS